MGVINHGLHWFETQSTRITDERSYEKLGFKSYLFILGGVVVDSFIKNPVDSCMFSKAKVDTELSIVVVRNSTNVEPQTNVIANRDKSAL